MKHLFFSILVKRIIIFVAYLDTMKQGLTEWETWLKESHFPDKIINTAYHVYKFKSLQAEEIAKTF